MTEQHDHHQFYARKDDPWEDGCPCDRNYHKEIQEMTLSEESAFQDWLDGRAAEEAEDAALEAKEYQQQMMEQSLEKDARERFDYERGATDTQLVLAMAAITLGILTLIGIEAFVYWHFITKYW